MKTLVIACALVACCTASGSWGYSSIAASPLGYGYGIAAYPNIDAATLVASRTIAAAPVAEAYKTYATAPLVAAAPAVRTYSGAHLVSTAPAFRAYGVAPAVRTYATAPIGLRYYGAGPIGLSAYSTTPAVAAVKTIATAPVVEATPVVAAAPTVVEAAPVVAAVKTIAPAPIVAAAPAVVASGVTKTQYHSQDELGQASYGHAEPLQTHNAVQDAHGNKVGSFSYLNPHDGQIHRTDYVADAHGYRVASNDLPIAARAKRSVLLETPASTVPLASHYIAPAITTYAVPEVSGYAVPAVTGYAASSIVAPGHALRDAVLTQIVNNPGHAVSYRVD